MDEFSKEYTARQEARDNERRGTWSRVVLSNGMVEAAVDEPTCPMCGLHQYETSPPRGSLLIKMSLMWCDPKTRRFVEYALCAAHPSRMTLERIAKHMGISKQAVSLIRSEIRNYNLEEE